MKGYWEYVTLKTFEMGGNIWEKSATIAKNWETTYCTDNPLEIW